MTLAEELAIKNDEIHMLRTSPQCSTSEGAHSP